MQKEEYDKLATHMDNVREYKNRLARYVKTHGAAGLTRKMLYSIPKDKKELDSPPDWRSNDDIVKILWKTAKLNAKNKRRKLKKRTK